MRSSVGTLAQATAIAFANWPKALMCPFPGYLQLAGETADARTVFGCSMGAGFVAAAGVQRSARPITRLGGSDTAAAAAGRSPLCAARRWALGRAVRSYDAASSRTCLVRVIFGRRVSRARCRARPPTVSRRAAVLEALDIETAGVQLADGS